MPFWFMGAPRSSVPHSGDRPDIPSSRSRLRRALPLLLRRPQSATAFVALAAALALIPLLLATLAFGYAFRAGERDHADSRLADAVETARGRLAATAATATDAARRLGESRRVQVALLRHDSSALAGFGSQHGTYTLKVAGVDETVAPPTGPAVLRTVAIESGGSTIGRVVASIALDPVVAAVPLTHSVALAVIKNGEPDGGRLNGLHVRTPLGVPSSFDANGKSYRVLRARFVPPSFGLVAYVPTSAINSAAHRRQLVVALAGLLTVIALALVAALLLRRSGAGVGAGRRSPVRLVGDVAAAAHDPSALLPVLLETAVVATNAHGGHVDWNGDRIATIGSPIPGRRELVLPLDDEERDATKSRIVLYAPRAGFAGDALNVAEALVAQGRIALENAHLQTVVRRQAVTDELTDLANRRRFMEVLHQEVARAARFEQPLALVLFDLDYFKQINDQYGHQMGDEVLRATAAVIRGRVRETDLPARVGGEEFGVILSGTDVQGATALAENLRIDLTQFVDVLGPDSPVTASFGVAEIGRGGSAEFLIGSADRALYRAKALGRNRVCSADGEASPAH
jgi:diguanylate cyclase (GGDEF)-like protein